MAKVKESGTNVMHSPLRPPLTPEAAENQMISLAVDLAKKQLMEGTASSQVITHYLKLGTVREKLELKRLESEIKLQAAKAEALERDKKSEELYLNAINAMKRYSGHGSDMDDEEDY